MVLVALFLSWRKVVLSTLHRDLAAVEGISVVRTDLLFLLLTALVVAVAVKIAGVVLVTALLIIPAATAQNVARTFLNMVGWSVGISVVALLLGVLASFLLNWPTGPTIVVAAALFFFLSLALRAGAH